MVRESVTNIRSLRVWVTPLRLLAEAQMILPVYIDPGVESLAGLSTHTCAVLLCLVCWFDFASFFLSSLSSLIKNMYISRWLLLLIFI